MKSKVYFTKSVSPYKVPEMYDKVGRDLIGNLAVKLHSGETGNQNYLGPDFWGPIIKHVCGTVVECNTAYGGTIGSNRNTTPKHLKVLEEHGWTAFPLDLLDAEGPDLVVDMPYGKQIKQNFLGKNITKYNSLLVLSHFKGHPSGGYGGALKQLSIGCASAWGKRNIHSAGHPERGNMNPEPDTFKYAMADAACSVHKMFEDQVVYINVMKNLSVDCDCVGFGRAEDPCMKDIGILASTDPVAIDQACIDLIWNSDDPGRDHFIERVESRHGLLTLERAGELGFGSREYELIEVE